MYPYIFDYFIDMLLWMFLYILETTVKLMTFGYKLLNSLDCQLRLPRIHNHIRVHFKLRIKFMFQPVVYLQYLINIFIYSSLIYNYIVALLYQLELFFLQYRVVLLKTIHHMLSQPLSHCFLHWLFYVVLPVWQKKLLNRTCYDFKIVFQLW